MIANSNWKVQVLSPQWVTSFNNWLEQRNKQGSRKLSAIFDGREISADEWEDCATAFDDFERGFAMEPALRLVRK